MMIIASGCARTALEFQPTNLRTDTETDWQWPCGAELGSRTGFARAAMGSRIPAGPACTTSVTGSTPQSHTGR
ncbi:hypothetical protein LSTR_LSTR009612 [Laodelphax striatellus]|uniref:Uncharacterized protein n=1 Tax=Laodelphax striatellus TaxID=195883 RepID=A0A482WJQ0_LAOST|nr:hypothetical protein LSTR_LSTR009612 [Laodelphax striatellus]